MEQVYTPKQNYKVLVRCMTYNQSKYIEDALNGFAMQKTDFPFVCLVMDDASTDGEQEVIKAWMERECDMERAENVEIEKSFITLVPHKTNSSCTFAFYFLKENLYKKGGKMPMMYPWREHCEYEALCEGDDYWIHPGKLQMQARALDENPECGLVRTDVNRKYEDGHIEVNFFATSEYENVKDTFEDYLLLGWWAAPCTWMYRIESIREEVLPNDCFRGDIALLLNIGSKNSIISKGDVTAVYRVLKFSTSHFDRPIQSADFMHKVANTRCYYARKYAPEIRGKLFWRLCKETRQNLINRTFGFYKTHIFLKYVIKYFHKLYM